MAVAFKEDTAECRCALRVGGQDVTVERLVQSLTYGGLLEGAPIAPMNERKLEPLRNAARSRGAYFIEPTPRSFLRTPGDMDNFAIGRWRAEWLPLVTVAMTLTTSGSRLEVLFFQDQFAPPLDDAIAAALQDLDWYAHAQDYDA
jgi:hypothetical protein